MAELSLMHRTSLLGMNFNCIYAGPATEPGLPGPEALHQCILAHMNCGLGMGCMGGGEGLG